MSIILRIGGKSEMVNLKISQLSFASLLAGLYVTYHYTDISAIPSYVWSMLAEELSKYMDTWMYEVQTLEDWIQHSLLITVKEILTEEELEELQAYTIYLDVMNGNVNLIIAGDIVWTSINTSQNEVENTG